MVEVIFESILPIILPPLAIGVFGWFLWEQWGAYKQDRMDR